MAGSCLSTYSIGSTAFGVIASLGLSSNFLERMERDFSTICIYALHSLMVNAVGKEMFFKVSAIHVSSDMFDLTLAISPYR
jgi:hypothetical protein